MKKFALLPLAALAFAACDDSSKGLLAPNGPQFHTAPSTDNSHDNLAPSLTEHPEPGAVLPNGATVSFKWTAPTSVPSTYTMKNYAWELSCTGSGCLSDKKPTVQLTALGYSVDNLPEGQYTFALRGEAQGPKHDGKSGTENHASRWKQISFTVGAASTGPKDNEISFAFPTGFAKTYGDDAFFIGQVEGITAEATSQRQLSFTSTTSACRVVDGTDEVVIVSVGDCTIKASEPGDGTNYKAADDKTVTFAINPAVLKVNANNATTDYGVTPSLSASLSGFKNGENATTADVTGVASCSIDAGTSTDAGTYAGVIACNAGTAASGLSAANYTFVAGSKGDLTINRVAPTISITSNPTSRILGATYTPVVSTNSDGTVSIVSLTPTICSVANGAVAFNAIGTCSIRANVAQGTNWLVGSSDPAHSFNVIYNFDGFFRPIEMGKLNRAKAGSAIPIKFSLGGDFGLSVISSAKTGLVACTATADANDVDEVVATAGSSSLHYDALTGQYTYVWKTSSLWASSCRQLVVTLNDGTERRVNFQFAK